ncbi:hypothetical protein ACJX0J_032536, partial [Zea mays]
LIAVLARVVAMETSPSGHRRVDRSIDGHSVLGFCRNPGHLFSFHFLASILLIILPYNHFDVSLDEILATSRDDVVFVEATAV